MTTKAHKNLTGVDLHEPKGVATATLDQVYRADGAGSGSWQDLTIPTGDFRVAITSFTTSGTWTKPANLMKVRVHVTAEGGGATSGDGSSASFGAHCSATGGQANGGTPGSGSSGDINLTGQAGLTALSGRGGSAAGPWFPKGKGTDDAANPGSGGGYSTKEILAASLAATVSVTIGATGAANGYVVVEETIST